MLLRVSALLCGLKIWPKPTVTLCRYWPNPHMRWTESGIGKVIEDARTEMARMIQLGELHTTILSGIRSAHYRCTMTPCSNSQRSRTGACKQRGAALSDKQIDDIGRRLLGACQAWSGNFARSSLMRS
jgi:hypothetical protein